MPIIFQKIQRSSLGLLFTIIAFTLTACGQKGALYLPEKITSSNIEDNRIETDNLETNATTDNQLQDNDNDF